MDVPQPTRPASVSTRAMPLVDVDVVRMCDRYGAIGATWGISTTQMRTAVTFMAKSGIERNMRRTN